MQLGDIRRRPGGCPCRFRPASVQGFKAREYLVVSRWNEFGIFVFLAYLAAAGFYFWARIVHTLDIGWTWWAGKLAAVG